MFQRNKPYSERIKSLNALNDHQEIAYLLVCHVFPWDTERALELALFRTFAIPSISKITASTGELVNRPRKRYDDTELILFEILESGYDSERAKRAFRRMNKMHGSYAISNEDMLYVLSTFVFEPIWWNKKFGWRPLRQNEKESGFYFFREVGKRMGIRNLPDDMDEFEKWSKAYAEQNATFSENNYKIGKPTLDLVLGFYIPKWLFPVGRPFLLALLDEPLIQNMGFKRPPGWIRKMMSAIMNIRKWIVRRLPESSKPRLGTRKRRPTYPEGYKIEELGTFPGSH
ncbi:MAG: oxygenase MpaB family protein [Saprospiraceae bacterium]